ncbi:MAG: S8 family serine peptidase [Chloroflexaceae bacterium]|nr:S8 family serine peptidase [Chloroflexaceae bacterium]
MKHRIPYLFIFIPVLLLITVLIGKLVAVPSAFGRVSPGPEGTGRATTAPSEPQPDPRVYLVRFGSAPLAAYRGDIPGLAATSPDGTGAQGSQKLDVQSAASVAYLDHLSHEQDQVIAAIEQAIGHSIEVLYRYTTVYNGISTRLTEQEAAIVAHLDGVQDVQISRKVTPETDAGPEWIGAPAVWETINSVYGLNNTRGEGIVTGLVDTGLTLDHPSFAATGDDGYTHINPKGAGNYLGWCDPEDPNYDPSLACNEKVIGVYVFDIDGVEADGSTLTPLDLDGHGTHVGSIMAGNVISDVVLRSPTPVVTFPMISGVAPHATIISYKQDGESASLVAAIDQAIQDGVDVINHSLGDDPLDPWEDAVAIAYLNARNAGVFVAKSSGNQGPSANTITSPGAAPWLTTVGFASHDRAIRQNGLVDLSGGDTTPPSDMVGGRSPAPTVPPR